MKRKQICKLLRANLYEAPSGDAVDRCLAALPPVRKRAGIGPLVRLQFRALPGYAYAVLLAAFLAALAFNLGLNMDDGILFSGYLLAGMGLLLGWHLALAGGCDMAELEHTCKYRYGDLLLAKWLCLGGLLLALCLIFGVMAAALCQAAAQSILVMVLPLSFACAAALASRLLLTIDNGYATLCVYLVTAVLVSWQSPAFCSMNVWAVAALLLAALAVTTLETRTLLNRSVQNEAYSM